MMKALTLLCAFLEGTAADDYAVTTLAGSVQGNADGIGTAALFKYVYDSAPSQDGLHLYVVDGAYRICQLELATTKVTTLAGSEKGYADGIGTTAKFDGLTGMSISRDGSLLFVADSSNNVIRKVSIATRTVTTIAGSTNAGFNDGTTGALFSGPSTTETSQDGLTLFVSEGGNNRVRAITLATGAVTTLAGSGGNPGASVNVIEVTPGTSAKFNWPWAMAASKDGITLFMTDPYFARVVKIDIATGDVSTLAGDGGVCGCKPRDGTGTNAIFEAPYGLALSADDSILYTTGADRSIIRQIVIATGEVTTIAGDVNSYANGQIDAAGLAASFGYPCGVTLSADGKKLFISDTNNYLLRQMTLPQPSPLRSTCYDIKMAYKADNCCVEPTGSSTINGTLIQCGAVKQTHISSCCGLTAEQARITDVDVAV